MIETASRAPSRRQFAQAIAVLAAAATPAMAQKAVVPDAKAYAAAMETVIRYRFGRQLSDEQVAQLHRSLLGKRLSADILKRVELASGDDPIAAFRADLP
jgi:hypothetical protein